MRKGKDREHCSRPWIRNQGHRGVRNKLRGKVTGGSESVSQARYGDKNKREKGRVSADELERRVISFGSKIPHGARNGVRKHLIVKMAKSIKPMHCVNVSFINSLYLQSSLTPKTKKVGRSKGCLL